jgi:agmatinase
MSVFTDSLKQQLKTAGKNRLALIGIPLDVHSSYMKGSASAPPLIREAFHCDSTNYWSETGIDLGVDSLFFDAGDIEFDSPEKAFEDIEQNVSLLLDHHLVPISLGGDHAITYPIIRAFHEKHPTMHILHFDAHPDLYYELDGDRHSHACPFARIMEDGLARHLIQVGIRGMNGHQRQQAEKFGVEVYEMKDWRDAPVLTFNAPLYISFDVDALDPAFAPGVSHFEPGGLTTRQAIQIIQRIEAPKIIGADIVEFNPKRDTTGMTAMVCAKILKEIAAKILA